MLGMAAWKDFEGVLQKERVRLEKVILFGSETSDLRAVRAKWETIIGVLGAPRQIETRYKEEEARVRGGPELPK
jgi:hypothetical protein